MNGHTEDLNPGAPTVPRPAASVILLRRGGRHRSSGLEVLLGKRTSSASFMANAWVFPGGAVDPTGSEPAEADYRATALRELEEEVSVQLEDPDGLVPFSRWITPAEVTVRFDTWFFVLEAPEGAEAVPDGSECVEARWLTPQAALDGGGRAELMLVFPTIKHLEALAEFESVEHALETARGRKVEPIQPRVVVGEDSAQVLLPGEPGYDDA